MHFTHQQYRQATTGENLCQCKLIVFSLEICVITEIAAFSSQRFSCLRVYSCGLLAPLLLANYFGLSFLFPIYPLRSPGKCLKSLRL